MIGQEDVQIRVARFNKNRTSHLNLNFQINNEFNIWDMLMLNKLLAIDLKFKFD